MDRFATELLRAEETIVEAWDAEDVRTAWRLLESSGYLDLTDPSIRDENRARFFARWTRPHAATSEHGLLLVRHGPRAIATLAANRLYGTTWLLHHFGVDRDVRTDPTVKRRICATTLGAGIDWLLARDDCEFLAMYGDATKRFNVPIYEGFARDHAPSPDISLRRIVVHKGLARAATHDHGTRVASAREADRIRDVAAARQPALETRAIRFADAAQPGRTVLLPRTPRPTAAAVVDCVEPGANLFGLSSPCRLVRLAEHVARDEFTALARAARAFLHERGFGEFVVVTAPEDAPGDAAARDANLSPGIPGFCCVIARAALPLWKHHIEHAL